LNAHGAFGLVVGLGTATLPGLPCAPSCLPAGKAVEAIAGPSTTRSESFLYPLNVVESQKSDGQKVSGGPLNFWTSLASDAMYFHAACRAFEQAKAAQKVVEQAHQRWRALEERERKAEADNNYNEMERVAIAMVDGADIGMAEAYGPYLEAVAIVHIMTTSALEAHVNECAGGLSGKEFEIFDKLSHEGKWLFLPRLMQWPRGFDCGTRPFQDFTLMVKRRNSLVHHKNRRVKTEHGQPPKFLEELGLTLEHAEHSVRTTKDMIRELANIRSRRPPYWIDRARYQAFNWQLEGLFSEET
jgi:hypothetical protein